MMYYQWVDGTYDKGARLFFYARPINQPYHSPHIMQIDNYLKQYNVWAAFPLSNDFKLHSKIDEQIIECKEELIKNDWFEISERLINLL